MSASHLGRNPFQKKAQKMDQKEEPKRDHFKSRSQDTKPHTWIRRVCIEAPARSFLFALRAALEVKKILER